MAEKAAMVEAVQEGSASQSFASSQRPKQKERLLNLLLHQKVEVVLWLGRQG